MYSLVGSALLVTDLLKQQEAGELLEVIGAALRLDAADLTALAELGGGRDAGRLRAARARAATLDAHRLRPADAVRAIGRAAAAGVPAAHEAAALAAGVSHAGLTDVLRLLAGDVFGWAPVGDAVLRDGVQVVCDAITAAWARLDLLDDDAALLAAPWRAFTAGRAAADVDLDLGPEPDAVRALLAHLAVLDEPTLAALEAAWTGAGGDWATAMHGACWAAYVADRLRLVAGVQLAAGRALLASGGDPRALSVRAGLVVPAAVAGLCLADLLDSDTFARLTAPVEAVYGPLR